MKVVGQNDNVSLEMSAGSEETCLHVTFGDRQSNLYFFAFHACYFDIGH